MEAVIIKKNYLGFSREVRSFTNEVALGLEDILGENLLSIYLIGSIALGDFREGSSDIDVMVVCKAINCPKLLTKLSQFHKVLCKETSYGKRLEVSYISDDMLDIKDQTGHIRPYYNSGRLRREAYGQEWFIDRFVLLTSGISISKESLNVDAYKLETFDIKDMSRTYIEEELYELIERMDSLDDEYLVFLILSLCRALSCMDKGILVSKSNAIEWMNKIYHHPYDLMLKEAIKWVPGLEFNRREEAKDFIQYISNHRLAYDFNDSNS